MKYSKVLICLFLSQLLLIISPLMVMGENPVSQTPETENQDKDKIEQAGMWSSKGIDFYKKNEYTAAIECFKKAVELNPFEVVYIINLASSYCENEKFEEAQKLLNESLDKFSKKENRKKLQIALADVHLLWAYNLLKKYNHTSAIRQFEMAYNIDKVCRPKHSSAELSNIGYVYSTLGKKHKALEYYEKALSIMQAVGDRGGEAATLNNIGRVYDTIGEKHKALEYFEKSLLIMRAVGQKSGEASVLNNIGLIYYAFGEKHKALEYFEKSLLIMQAVGQRYGEATALHNIGSVYSDSAENNKALEYYQKALKIRREVGDRKGEAMTLIKIGNVYYDLGHKKKALQYYQETLTIKHEVGDREGEATTLAKIADVNYDLGQKKKALQYYQDALTISREMGDRKGEATILHNIGLVCGDLGEKKKALKYYKKALPIIHAVGDGEREGTIFHNIGIVYFDLEEKKKALEYYQKALAIRQEMGNREGEATTLNNIGRVYDTLGDKKKALEHYEKALSINRTISDRSGEATTLTNIGKVYSDLGQKNKALENFQRALPIIRAIGDKSKEATILNNFGVVYDALGERQKALEYYQIALKIRQEVGDREGEAITLINIGHVYYVLGERQKALEYYRIALPIIHSVGNRDGEAATLNNIGLAYSELSKNQKALEYYQKALSINRTISDRSGEATTLTNIGSTYSALGEKKKALEYFEKALTIWIAVGDQYGEAITLNNIGGVYSELGQKNKALKYYLQALIIKRATGDREGEAKALNNSMRSWEGLKKRRLAIFYGKQSVSVFQKLRTNISGLKRKLQKSYLKSKNRTYRKLINILISEGRLSEAQQILDMLKEQEYFDFIRRDSSSAAILSTQVDFTVFEKQWLEKYNTALENLSNINNEYHMLKFKKNKNDVEKKRMVQLEMEMKEAQKAYEGFLTQLKDAFDKHEKEIKEGKIDPDTQAKEASALQGTLKYLDETGGGKNSILHYLVYENRISAIITLPNSPPLLKQWDINEKELNGTVMNYITFILKSGEKVKGIHLVEIPTKSEKNLYGEILNEMLRYEKKLYDLVFKPVADELQKYGATNLMISLDGVLRYIPFAALWDGKNYMVQRYRMAIITPSSLKNIKDEPMIETKILGLCASKGGRGFAPLYYARREIRSIVKDKEKGFNGLIEGKAFLDRDFTKDTMVNHLKTENYPIVHISSHFKFSPGDETKNFLLLGDGNILKLSEIRRMGKLFDKVNLLVLSACQTGVGGNGEEIDGFGELAQQSGAKSVVASLWPVADESTKDLMVAFYRNLKEEKVTSKIEALRQAQLELAGLEDLLEKSNRKARKKTKYSHPYYWGAFIMMGNWR